MTKTGYVLAAAFAAVSLIGCEVNPPSSTTVVHDRDNPPVVVHDRSNPSVIVTPPSPSTHTDTHTNTTNPPDGGPPTTTSNTTTTGTTP